MHLPGGRLKPLKPAIFIPTLYFIEGLPYALVVVSSVVFYTNLGLPLKFIGEATSQFYLPWVLKFAWAPMVDMVGTKRGWIVVAQAVLSLVSLAFALTVGALPVDSVLPVTIAGFWLMAFISATQDVAIDGYYLETLNKEERSYFVGVRNSFYKVAMLFGQGFVVYLVGTMQKRAGMTLPQGWALAFGLCSAIFLIAAVFHYFGLPKQIVPAKSEEELEKEKQPKPPFRESLKTFLTIFKTYFDQEKILWIVIYILIFRLGDAFALKMAYPFLLASPKTGGLACDMETLGEIQSVGVIFLLLGGILGGIVVSKLGLKRTLMPTAIFQNISILLYYFLAQYRPNMWIVGIFNAIEQFGYGLGTAAYTVFLLSTVKTKYKAGHYAIATAMMAFGVMMPGMYSGYMAEALGYKTFFLVSFLAAIPGMMVILLLPMEDK